MRHSTTALAAPLALFAAYSAAQPAPCAPAFPTGTSTLFIGHSFFMPVSERFNELAEAGDYPDHAFDNVGAGGASGSPLALWNDPVDFDAINTRLAQRDVDLLGMTAYDVFPGGDSDVEAYSNWIDLALAYNPDTSFFIGLPWVPTAPEQSLESFEQGLAVLNNRLFGTVDALRRKYPGTRILFANYGSAAYETVALYEAGGLPDAGCLLDCEDALFRDARPGHAGPVITELSAAVWMHTLYGADPSSLSLTVFVGDVVPVVEASIAYNAPYQTPPQDLERDGVLDLADIDAFIGAFVGGEPEADFNADGVRDLRDITLFVGAFGNGCR